MLSVVRFPFPQDSRVQVPESSRLETKSKVDRVLRLSQQGTSILGSRMSGPKEWYRHVQDGCTGKLMVHEALADARCTTRRVYPAQAGKTVDWEGFAKATPQSAWKAGLRLHGSTATAQWVRARGRASPES